MCYDCGRINGHISTLDDSQPGLSSSAFAQSLAKTQMFVLFSVCLASGSDSLLRDSSLSLFPDSPFRLLLLLLCLLCLSLSFSYSVFHSCVSLSVCLFLCLFVCPSAGLPLRLCPYPCVSLCCLLFCLSQRRVHVCQCECDCECVYEVCVSVRVCVRVC